MAKPIMGWPGEVREVFYESAADGTKQPALFYAPGEQEKRPLLVALHTWSGNYRQAGGEASYGAWCIRNGWVMIHPDFRGPNRTAQALGSELAVADIASAVEFAKENAAVDASRIYLVGVSGGGHAALLMAGRAPEIWAGVSAWCGISDLAAWHGETMEAGREKYARDILGALGAEPGTDPEIDDEYRLRSPLTHLGKARGVPLDINAGVRDGREGSVPFRHSLWAFTAVVGEENGIPAEEVTGFYESMRPPAASGALRDPLYGERLPLYRRISGDTRVTIFEGGHEIVHLAALNWLAHQRKGEPAVWAVEKVSDLPVSEADAKSGR